MEFDLKQVLVPHARRIEVDGVRCGLAASVAGRLGRLCVAVPSTMADPRIGKLLAQNLCEAPQADLAVMELFSTDSVVARDRERHAGCAQSEFLDHRR